MIFSNIEKLDEIFIFSSCKMSHYNFFITQIIKLGHVTMKLISMNYANYFLSETIDFQTNKKFELFFSYSTKK